MYINKHLSYKCTREHISKFKPCFNKKIFLYSISLWECCALVFGIEKSFSKISTLFLSAPSITLDSRWVIYHCLPGETNFLQTEMRNACLFTHHVLKYLLKNWHAEKQISISLARTVRSSRKTLHYVVRRYAT